MEVNFLSIILIVTNIAFIILAVYVLLQYKSKKKDSISLEDKIRELKLKYSNGQGKLKQLIAVYNKKRIELKNLLLLAKRENELIENVKNNKTELQALGNELKVKSKERDELYDEINSIKSDISIFSPTLDFINLGFFEEPVYLFETSDRFKEEIKSIRDKQKKIIKDKKAILIPDNVAITTNNTYAKKILNGQVNLMLKAFNTECDKLMGTVKPDNFAQILERIDKLASDIEKSSLSLKCGFNKEYIKLKFNECELQYQFKLKQRREQEEQAIIREQIREEQKAIREFERALAKAQREEKMYQEALEEAKKQLEVASDQEKDKLNKKIELLEKNLQEALESEKRAKSMAEQTKRGHVYIISNIGSFGDDVYKIGLTRRLNPIERVKELGDASVPFAFDVHAMIFSENAPFLEKELHHAFTYNRVNSINYRKEFFNVTLDDIKQKAEEIFGTDIDFKMTAIAEEYYESKRLRSRKVSEANK